MDGDRLLEQLGLADKRDAWFMTLSGGQKQRLFIALALINDPEVVFLDELTTGLDPQARRAIWDLVRGIRERGKTVFLTTHLMEEAERLCDRVAIIEHGRDHRHRHAGRSGARGIAPSGPSCVTTDRPDGRRALPSAGAGGRGHARTTGRLSRFAAAADDLVTDVIQCLARASRSGSPIPHASCRPSRTCS